MWDVFWGLYGFRITSITSLCVHFVKYQQISNSGVMSGFEYKYVYSGILIISLPCS